jgi:Na+/proline symporter
MSRSWRTVVVALSGIATLTGTYCLTVITVPMAAYLAYSSYALAIGGIVAVIAGRSAAQAFAVSKKDPL